MKFLKLKSSRELVKIPSGLMVKLLSNNATTTTTTKAKPHAPLITNLLQALIYWTLSTSCLEVTENAPGFTGDPKRFNSYACIF